MKVLRLVLIMMLLGMGMAMAQTFTYPINGKQGFSLPEKTRDGLRVNYNLGQFSLNPIDNRGESMSEISISGIVLPNEEGYPNLPVESRMLAVPQGAEARLTVLNVESEIVRDVDIAPALRIQAESEEPEFNYVKNQEVYGKNAFYPENPFTIDRSSIRGVDVVAVSVSPFQYNPVTKELKVYTNIELSVSFEGGNGHFGDDRLRSPYWDPILAAELMNYDQLPVIDYAARMQQWLRDGAEGAEYVIITPNNDGWAEYANQLRDYRTRQGIFTKVYRLDEMPVSTTEEMKAWFHNAYNTWTIPPVAVLLFGDHGTDMSQYIPAETVSHLSGGTCITDNGYADPTGDNLPDMVFSRLVAANATEAQMMVSKQIEYEYSNPNMNAATYNHPITALGWETDRWFQICSEVVGGYWRNQGKHPVRINEIYGGTPGNVWSSESGAAAVVAYFGPNGLGYIPATPSELGGWTGGTGAQVVAAVNNGSMLLQHRDHGNAKGWGKPDFSTTNVAQMNNVGKLTFVNTINCQTGMFNYDSDCLIEAFMRRTYNGQNAGAVGCVGPTEVSYSYVNDAFTWGMYDQYDPNFVPDYGPYASYEGNWQPAFGNVAGKYFLQQCAWLYGYGAKDITYKMFTAHCDAFLRLYTQVPRTMVVSHTNAVVAGGSSITVSAPEGCMISLVKANNVDGGWDILAVASATGASQVIEFEPQVPPTVIHIIVTGQDYLRYEDTIEVAPAQGSFLAVDSYTPQNAPVNQLTPFSMTFRNVGLDATTGTTTVTLSSQDDRLTIVDGTGQFGALGSNQVVTLANEFSFIIAQDVPDNTRFTLNITMTCGTQTWTGVATITTTQAVLTYVGMSWAEIFDPGETVTVTATFKNSGHYRATNAVAHIASTSQYVSFVSNTYTVGTLEANAQVECTFNVVIPSNCPESEQMPITLTLNADGGLVVESAEILKNTFITVVASPNEGGTVSGFGKFVPGTTVTISATPSESYVFSKWTLNGAPASYFPTYTFEVTGDAEYVANFQEVNNGVVIGDGSGANDYLPSYSYYRYSMSQQIYSASELNIGVSDISNVSFFNAGTTKTRSYTIYMVNTSKTTFDSNTDWITVTEADQVFSGSVTMTTGSWTTIYFSTPFAYDGSSNVALIVDDNTGNWNNNNMSCRVSSTGNYQALCVYSDQTNFNPNSPDNYSGFRLMVKNQVIFGVASYDYTVTASAGPDGGGTVSGGGLCYFNQPITLTATPNEGYVFSNWTKDGTVVSYLSTYNLSVTESAEYVANFQEVTSGFVIGNATYTNAYLPTYYYYSLSEQIYTAEEMGGSATEISSVSFFNTGTSNRTRNLSIYMVNTDKTMFEGASDWIPVSENDLVFSGNITFTARGWATVSFSTPFNYDGTSNVALIVDDNSNSYNSYTSCRTFDTEVSQVLRISGSGTNYDPYNPTDYEGSLMSMKNQIILRWPSTITATASPTEGGIVSGSGSYAIGATCTLTATPNAGYYFLNWTEDGTVVSYDATYSFTVDDDRNLVANFVEGESTCNIVFDLHDSYGDGWNGNYLVVDYGDGNSEQFTIQSGSSASYTRAVETGSIIALSWISGSFISECSFDVNFDNGVLIYHKSGISSSFQQELSINCAVATAPHVITAVAVPEEGGTVEGAGTYDGGTNVTLTAIPNEGYSFCFWSENGQQVSTNSSYSFLVSSDRNLVARFSLPLTISVTTNMASGGTVTGAGTFYYGNTCTLTATPNEGYLFLNWSKNGVVVSCNASYSFAVTEDADLEAVFMRLEGTLIGQGEATNNYLPSYSNYNYTLSQQIYTPNEIGEAGNITTISYFNAGVTQTRNYNIYMVHTDKLTFGNNTDWITVTEADRVYSGSVTITKGYWTTIVLDTPFAYNGTSNLAIIVDDNTGTWSSIMACRVFNTNGSQAIRVYSDGTNYNPMSPPTSYGSGEYSAILSKKNHIILGITPCQTFTKEINAYTESGGYYLISIPVEEVAPEEVEHLLDNNYDLYAFDESQELEWINYKNTDNGFADLVAGRGYLYANSEDVTLSSTGTPYNGNGEVILSKTGDAETAGWNLVGNPFAVTAYIDRAFYVMNDDGSEIVPADRDYIEPMEGVFVIAESDGETMTFSTTEPSKSPRLVLNLSSGPSTSSGTAIIDRAIVRFAEGRMLPKLQIKESSSKLFIQQDGKDYAVVNSGDMGEMLVGFKAEQSGSYTLSFSSENVEFSYLHLIDDLTVADIDLLDTSTGSVATYTFNARQAQKILFRLVYRQ